jgi:cytochrome b561
MKSRYDRIARVLHWLVAALLLAQCAFGYWLGVVPRNTPERGYFINLHKSTGLLIGLLILWRIYWRLKQRAPAYRIEMARWQQGLAHGTHHILYVLMLVLPLSGYIASNLSKHGVKFFNVIVLPAWGPDDKLLYGIFNQTHKIAAVLLLGLVALHMLAALWHAWRRDDIFSRISLRPF